MRSYKLRVYTLRDRDALRFYAGTIYPRHLQSFPKFGVQAHGFWTAKDDETPRLFVLVSYAAGDAPREIEQRYLRSPELAEDIHGFDLGNILSVDTTVLVPSIGSPLM